MEIIKTIKVPIHYAITKEKFDKLNKLTARLTFCIRLMSELIERHDIRSRKALRAKVKEHGIRERTGLNAAFVQQCEDKALWMWKSHRKLHREWKRKVKRAQHENDEQWLKKLVRREPQPPFHNKQGAKKISPRVDIRTGSIEFTQQSRLAPLWLKLSTLELRGTMRIPLNPARYHLEQLRAGKISDFEIIKRDGRFYVHIAIVREVQARPINSVRGIDLGINRAVATVLLPLGGGEPREELWINEERRKRIEKFDEVVTKLQQKKEWAKLRELRHKRANVARYHDWLLANQIVKNSRGCVVAIGRTNYKRRMFKGDGDKQLRKLVHRWAYARIIVMTGLKCAEQGIQVVKINEAWTSRTCHRCGSTNTERPTQEQFICKACGLEYDADLNAAHNIASRCQVDRLKAGMIWTESSKSPQDGSPTVSAVRSVTRHSLGAPCQVFEEAAGSGAGSAEGC
jgi:IS605 OrfB family transposase